MVTRLAAGFAGILQKMDVLALLIGLGVLLLIPTAYAGWIGAPWAPTRIAVVKKGFDHIRLSSSDVVYDLGAGDGKILLESARRGARAVGFELSPIMWVVAWIRCRGHADVTLKYGNFFTKPLGDATVVFAFLMPENMIKVREYLAAQVMPRGAYFLSYAFPLPDVVPLKIVSAANCAPLYIYDLAELTRH